MSITDILNRKYRWPKAADRLLRPHWEDGVLFSDDGHSRDGFIWDGYMKAGAALVHHVIENDRDGDFLIYPILFNYRHGLEVAIKWVLDRYGRYAAIEEYDSNHR